ncbi:MAG: efflux RND transporter permease subunit [Bacteroidales bacterium]|nr:efflux RND transporter permease subunit [Bacteroidales bacterium]
MYRIARFAVKYPVTVLMLVLGILLLGLISFGKLGTDLFPDLNTPAIYIELKAGERPPEEIERNYVDQIESLAMRQSDVTQVSSVSKAGSALITVGYEWGKDMDDAFLNLQKELRAFAQNSDLEDFTISQYDPNAAPVMTVALRNERITNMDELRKTAENYIRNELIRIEGVADVRLSGQEESEVVIETSKYILEAYGISADDISAKIAGYNRNASGGSITEMGLKYTIKGISVLQDLDDIGNIIVAFRQKQSPLNQQSSPTASENVPVYLRDIAKIRMENKKPEDYVTVDGQRCISLLIYKEPKFNTVDAVSNLDKAFGELAKALPGYEFIRIHDQGNYIKSAISEVRNTLIVGVILAVFVLYLFLRRIGTTLAVSIAIPVSIIATFNLMYFNHLTLNIMTLGGLALGAGMLVDNAIVVLENISRNREEGMDLKEAVITGTGQVGGAITASTITTIVVFLPIVYLHGASGELFKDQAWTVAFSLISSLLVALLVIPMLASLLASGKEKNSYSRPSIHFAWYKNFLRRVLEKRWLIVALSAIILLITGLLVPRLGSEFMPKPVSSEFTLNLKLPEGTALERTVSTVANTESMIREMLPGKIKMIYARSGEDKNTSLSNPAEGSGQNTASMKVILKDEFKEYTDEAIALIENYLRNVPDLEFSFTREETALQSSLGITTAPFELEVSGKELSELERILEESRQILAGHPGLYNITTSIDEGTPQVEISIDRFRCSYYGITVDNVIGQIKSFLSGSSAGTFEQGGETKDITIKLGEITIGQLRDMIIASGNLKMPLSELAGIKTVKGQREITRRNQTRTAYLYAMVRKGEKFDHVVNKAGEMLGSISLPPEYKIEFTGEELKRKESMSNLTFALILSLILVYMVLASQFESLLQPLVIMLTIPLAAVGTVLTFFILGKSLNMMAYIGIIMLAGIAVNNAIILIDRINQLRKEGMQVIDAVVNAGGQRIRPILMTSLTTILALLPLTAGIGESASLRSPMALAVIGGLVTSTVLTLVLIPCVYLILTNAGKRYKNG